MESYRRFLLPEVVSKLKRMDLKARLVVEGFLTGLHRSPYRGFSVEFTDYRPYMPGDEPKRIDWKIYGKTDRYYVKEFEEETNLKAYLLLDASGSMGYSSKGLSKLEYSSYLCASLSYLLLKQQDSVGLVVFDHSIRKYIPPRSTYTHLHVLLKELDGIRPGGETSLSGTFHELAGRIKRRGLIIVCSDLFDDPEEVLLGLKHFRHKKHEVICFQVLDNWERDFPFNRAYLFKDMETGEELPVEPRQVGEDYRIRMSRFLDQYRRRLRENLIDWVPLSTHTPFDAALFSYLAKRKRLG